MKLPDSVGQALALLTKRDKRILIFVIFVQALLGLMDMLGIAMIGLVVGFAATFVTGGSSGLLISVQNRLGLQGTDPLVLITWIACLAAAFLLAKSVMSFLLTRRTFTFLANRQAIVSGRIVAKLLDKSFLDVYARTSQENAFALTTGISSAMLGIIGQVVVICSEAALLVILSLGLFLINPAVTLFTYIYFGLVAFGIHFLVSKRAERLGKSAANADITSLTAVQEVLRNYREAFISGRRQIYVNRFQQMRWVAAGVQADLYILSQVAKYVFDVALIIGAGLLVVSQVLTSELASGLAVVAVFYLAASRIMPSLMRVQGALIDMKHAKGNAKATFDLVAELGDTPGTAGDNSLRYSTEIKLVEYGIEIGYRDLAPNVIAENLTFCYPGTEKNALENVSFTLGVGESIALVGSTGAGKSTLADMILGVISPDSGSISIAGISPEDAVIKWPGFVGYVPQDIVVVGGTIRENVALGLPDHLVHDELIWDALKRAHLDEFLLNHRSGLDTKVGEHGMKLSGGQRQRLGLARALYTKPKLLVLDEATSALDAQTEHEITTALAELSGSVTQVVIAHRLATVRHCTTVAYLENGFLAALGTFTEVKESSDSFKKQAELLGL